MGQYSPDWRFSIGLLEERLSEVVTLKEHEKLLLREQRQSAQSFSAGATMAGAHPAPRSLKLIAAGWACHERISADGRRQVLSILLPGDLIGDCMEERALDEVALFAITRVRLIDLGDIVAAIRNDPDGYSGLLAGFANLRNLEERRLLDQIVRLASLSGAARVASLVLELFQRCSAIGFVAERSFVMPLTQDMIGDALGLSVVHVNRVIRQMKQDHLISLHAGVVEVTDPAGLACAAGMVSGGGRCRSATVSLAHSTASA